MFSCCFGFRDRSRAERPSLRASLVREEFSGGINDGKEGAAAAASARKNKGTKSEGDKRVTVAVPSSSTTTTVVTSLPRPRPIPFVRVQGSSRGKGKGEGTTLSQGSVQSPEALAALLGVADRDARILLPPSSPAAPPPRPCRGPSA